MGLVQRWIYSHTKVSKQSNNNNDGRSNFKRSTKAKNINNGTDTGNISPGNGNSGSSSLVTRQVTSTTCTPLTSVHYGAATAIPIVGAIQLRNLANENSNNKNDHDDNGHLNELAELVEETDEYDEQDHGNQRETTILIFRNEMSNQNNHSGSHVPSQVITMFTGNGTNTIVTTSKTTRSTTRKLMSISSSLLSLRSDCSSVEEEQQV